MRDDGQGIHKDDLNLALQAHATSKLSHVSDLSQIVSLGFRGEAIPSIASVSRFKMTSRLADREQAWSIDNMLQIKPAAHETGTTVEVNDLFFSTPGRRKFLKSEKTEYLHIQSLIRAISLSHFATGFFVKHNGQQLFRLPACDDDIEQRVVNVCGRSFLNKCVRIDTEKDGLHLWGWLGLNDVARSQSDRQYFYVNGRLVRDKHVNHAIRLAYEDRIAVGRHPSFVLHLQLDPSLLDVNVHPAKSEVRFAETRNIHDFIYGSLIACLNKPIISVTDDEGYETKEDTLQTGINEAANVYNTTNFNQADILQAKKASRHLSLYSGQFVIATINNDEYLIDVAKARSCITTQYLLNNFHSSTISKRPVLVPVSSELKQDRLELVLNQTSLINQWGFELEQITPTQILIRSLPSRLVYADIISLVNDLLDALFENHSEQEIATTLAAHVNDAGVALNDEDIAQLINEILFYEDSFDKSDALPWRKLDSQALRSLLED